MGKLKEIFFFEIEFELIFCEFFSKGTEWGEAGYVRIEKAEKNTNSLACEIMFAFD